MIFDAHLKPEGVLFRCAKEDYETEPWYSCRLVLLITPSEEEDCPVDISVDNLGWVVHGDGEVPAWAKRLLYVLEPRIRGMLLTGQPTDLRRWIDDGLLEELEEEHHETAQA